MSVEFYLFDVDHGQSAALRLPDGRWCLFDIGSTGSFSPTRFVRAISGQGDAFRYYKATISHWHGDHLADHQEFVKAAPEFIRTVKPDTQFISDVKESSAEESFQEITTFGSRYLNHYTLTGVADYGPFVRIDELSLPVDIARILSSSSNSAVNNSSVVTRISCYGYSILICGDMEAEAWSFVLNQSIDKVVWRKLVAGVKMLIAPHHGHASAYSTDLLNLANPEVVLASVKSGDEHVDSRYSSIQGMTIGGEPYKMISTRQKGTVKVAISPGQTLLSPASTLWWFDADGRRAADQRKLMEAFIRPQSFPTIPTILGSRY